MKNCMGCKYAEWNRTKTGALHPSGDGYCRYPWKLPPLPASLHWMGTAEPTPYGGCISRREEFKDHCPYYVREDKSRER